MVKELETLAAEARTRTRLYSWLRNTASGPQGGICVESKETYDITIPGVDHLLSDSEIAEWRERVLDFIDRGKGVSESDTLTGTLI